MPSQSVNSTSVQVASLELSSIEQSEYNRRQIDPDDPSIKDLAQSMAAVGMLSPLVVRQKKDKRGVLEPQYELLAGARRLAAARSLGWDEISVIVYEGDDVSANAVSVVENLQREQLDPFREAEAIQQLYDAGKETKEIALLLGRSATWVARRARVTKLADVWQKARSDPKHGASQWPVTYFELISRFQEHVQQGLYKKLFGDAQRGRWCASWEVDHLKEQLAEVEHRLDAAPWKLDDEGLHPKAGACANCPKRSDRQPELFEDDAPGKKAKGGAACLDFTCWDVKLKTHIGIKKAAIKKDHGEVIQVSRDRYRTENGVLGNDFYHEVKQKTPGAKPALVVDGEDQGRQIWVKVGKTSSSGGGQARVKGEVTPLKERRRRLEGRRWVQAYRNFANYFAETTEPPAHISIADLVFLVIAWDVDRDSRAELLGSKNRYLEDAKVWEAINTWTKKDAERTDSSVRIKLWKAIQGTLAMLVTPNGIDHIPKTKVHADNLAELFRIDLEPYYEISCRDIPTPRSWAGLREDGTPTKVKGPKKKSTGKVAAEKKIKPEKKTGPKTTKTQAAFMAKLPISDELAAVVGAGPMCRTDVTLKFWGYIKKNGLQDSVNKRMINADEKLKKVFGGKAKVSMFEMTKLVSKHLDVKPKATPKLTAPTPEKQPKARKSKEPRRAENAETPFSTPLDIPRRLQTEVGVSIKTLRGTDGQWRCGFGISIGRSSQHVLPYDQSARFPSRQQAFDRAVADVIGALRAIRESTCEQAVKRNVPKVIAHIQKQYVERKKPRRGVCYVCGCTEAHACDGGCSWVDEKQNLCSACDAELPF